jgi:hypothetical protein
MVTSARLQIDLGIPPKSITGFYFTAAGLYVKPSWLPEINIDKPSTRWPPDLVEARERSPECRGVTLMRGTVLWHYTLKVVGAGAGCSPAVERHTARPFAGGPGHVEGQLGGDSLTMALSWCNSWRRSSREDCTCGFLGWRHQARHEQQVAADRASSSAPMGDETTRVARGYRQRPAKGDSLRERRQGHLDATGSGTGPARARGMAWMGWASGEWSPRGQAGPC